MLSSNAHYAIPAPAASVRATAAGRARIVADALRRRRHADAGGRRQRPLHGLSLPVSSTPTRRPQPRRTRLERDDATLAAAVLAAAVATFPIAAALAAAVSTAAVPRAASIVFRSIASASSQTRVCTGMTSMPRGRGGASLQVSVAILRHYRPGLCPGTFKKRRRPTGSAIPREKCRVGALTRRARGASP